MELAATMELPLAHPYPRSREKKTEETRRRVEINKADLQVRISWLDLHDRSQARSLLSVQPDLAVT
jgi:hypothetical protein